ncbi:uncharacterized protein LOC144952835 [Lampetra fluviatilis]
MSPKKKSTHRKKKSGVTTGTAAAAAVTNRDGFPSADDADDGCVSVPGLRHRVPRRLLAAHVPLERVAVERVAVAVAPAVAVPSKPPSSKSSSASSSDSSSKSPSFGRSLSSSLGGSVGPRSAGGPGTDRRAGTRTGATVVGGAAAAAVVPPPCGPPEGEGLHAVRVRRAPDAALQATVAVPFRYSSYEGALDVDARLIRAFGAFPYPTRERALRLARRAGAAVSGVWAWFEAQRLKHGISWTPEEVLEARLRLRVGAADDDDDDDAGAGEAQPEAPGGSGAGLGAAAATGGVARTTAAGATAAGALSYDCKQKILWESYRRSAYVDATECQRLSQETGLLPEAVRRWFKKKRANSGGAWQQLPRSKRQPWHRNVSGRFIRSEEAGALPANGDQSGPAESSAPALPPPALPPPPHAGKQWSWTRETSARTTWQRELLQVNYEANPYPSEETIACLASEVGLKPHQVKKYFSNRRYTVKLARESVGGGDAGGGGGFGGRRSSGAGGGGNAGGGGYSVTVGYADGGGNAGGGGGSFGGRRSSGGNAGGGGYAATVDHAGTVSHSGGGGGHAGTVSHSPTVSHSGGGGGNAGTGDACRARRARRTKKYIGGKKTYEQLAILNRAFDESRSPSPALYASLAQETRLAVCTVRNFFNKKRYKLLHAKSHTRRRYGWWGVARGGGGQVDGELGGSAAVAGGDGDGGDDGDGGGVVARWYEASDQDGVLVMDMGSGGGP